MHSRIARIPYLNEQTRVSAIASIRVESALYSSQTSRYIYIERERERGGSDRERERERAEQQRREREREGEREEGAHKSPLRKGHPIVRIPI